MVMCSNTICEFCDDKEAKFVWLLFGSYICKDCMNEVISNSGDHPEDYRTVECYEQAIAEELFIEEDLMVARDALVRKCMSDFIDQVIRWAVREDVSDVYKWELYLERYLIDMGWNSKAIADFVNMGDGGFNYSILHIDTSLESFYDEVHYCSDRMSMDRLLRCHIQYRTINGGCKS